MHWHWTVIQETQGELLPFCYKLCISGLGINHNISDHSGWQGLTFGQAPSMCEKAKTDPSARSMPRQASHVVSIFAEAVDECQPHGRGSVGTATKAQIPAGPSLSLLP